MNKVSKFKYELDEYVKKEKEMLKKKRERETKEKKEVKNNTTNNDSNPKPSYDVHTLLTKIFDISNKNASFEKCIKLLNFVILKLDSSSQSTRLNVLIKLFTKAALADYHLKDPGPLTLHALYNKGLTLLSEEEKENKKYQILLSLEILFNNELNLMKDDSFVFTSTESKLHKILSSLADYTKEEEEVLSKYLNEIDNEKVVEEEDFDLFITGFKRKLLFSLYDNLPITSPQMQMHITQIYRNIILNERKKLSESMQLKLKKNLNGLKKKGTSTFDDNKIKSTPLESYYTVTDAREEKIIMSNMTKWESKQNGIKETKQYI